MMLTISILSGINYLISIVKNIQNGKIDVNIITASILIISTWESCLPLELY